MVVRTFLGVVIFISLTCGDLLAATYDVPLGESSSINLNIGDVIRTTGYPNRSYCCQLLAPVTGASAVTFSSVNGSQSLIDTGTSRGYATPQVNGKDVSSAGNARYCWHEGGSTAAENAVFSTAGLNATTDVLCEETTLIGGFNTSVTDFNFLEITVLNEPTNIFSSDFKGVVIIKTTVGAKTIKVPFTITLEPSDTSKRKDISIHDAVSNVKDFGEVSIIHSGSKNQVKAKMTQYRIVTQTPLDFEPVLQEVFKPVTEH